MTTPEGKENAPIVCEECGSSFSHSHLLLRHLRTHAGEKPLSCNTCGKSFGHEERLVTHLCKRAEEYSCDTCGKSFSHEDRLVTHWCTRTGQYPCDICGKIFGHEDRLVTHWCTRTGEYPCDICGKIFGHEDRLVTHWCTRTGEYTCDICGKSFGHEDRLVTHLCIRAEKYPDTCGKSFSRDAYLRVHPCTPATESAPHSCDTCGRSCCQKPRLSHSGKIKSRSGVRGRRSSRRSALVNPVVVRSEKGDYLCGLCGRNFSRAVYVLSHLRRFHRRKVEPQENGAQGRGTTAMADSSGLQLITSHLGGLQLFI